MERWTGKNIKHINLQKISSISCCTLSSQSFCWFGDTKHNALDQFWRFKLHFKHFPRNTQFVSFDGPLISCLYFRNTDWHFTHQGNVCHPTSKSLKRVLVEKLSTFWNPFWGFFLTGRHLLLIYKKHNSLLLLLNSW